MPLSSENLTQLAANIRTWGKELGFQQVGITDIDLAVAEDRLNRWLDSGYHGEMDYMARHGSKRSRPELLVENTRRVISVRMDYLPDHNEDLLTLVEDPALAYVTRYALGRDYHKVLRRRLQQLASRIEREIGPFGYRAFVDSAPVLEKPLANKAGLGWNILMPVVMVLGFAFIFSSPNSTLYKVGVLGGPVDAGEAGFLATRHIRFIAQEDEAEAIEKVRHHRIDLLVDIKRRADDNPLFVAQDIVLNLA